MKHIKGIRKHNSSRKGDFAEYYAVTWLWDNGYEVFKNCGCTGMIDLVAIDKKGNIKLIDVKTFIREPRWTGTHYSKMGHSRTAEQKKKGIQILGFNPMKRSLRFVEHKK